MSFFLYGIGLSWGYFGCNIDYRVDLVDWVVFFFLLYYLCSFFIKLKEVIKEDYRYWRIMY